MQNFIVLFEKILGKEETSKLITFTRENIRNKFSGARYNKLIKISKINYQMLLLVATLKAKGISDEKIEKNLYWKRNSKYILCSNINEYNNMYSNYILDIIKFINRI